MKYLSIIFLLIVGSSCAINALELSLIGLENGLKQLTFDATIQSYIDDLVKDPLGAKALFKQQADSEKKLMESLIDAAKPFMTPDQSSVDYEKLKQAKDTPGFNAFKKALVDLQTTMKHHEYARGLELTLIESLQLPVGNGFVVDQALKTRIRAEFPSHVAQIINEMLDENAEYIARANNLHALLLSFMSLAEEEPLW